MTLSILFDRRRLQLFQYPVRQGMVFCLAGALLACDSGSSHSGAGNNLTGAEAVVTQAAQQAVTLTGTISGEDGPIKQARLVVQDHTGKTVATAELTGTIQYRVDVPAGAVYPLVITAHFKAGTADQLPLKAVLMSPSFTQNDITPLSTAIVEKAQGLGGFSEKNVMQATLNSSSAQAGRKNKTEAGFSGDPTRQYGGWH